MIIFILGVLFLIFLNFAFYFLAFEYDKDDHSRMELPEYDFFVYDENIFLAIVAGVFYTIFIFPVLWVVKFILIHLPYWITKILLYLLSFGFSGLIIFYIYVEFN